MSSNRLSFYTFNGEKVTKENLESKGFTLTEIKNEDSLTNYIIEKNGCSVECHLTDKDFSIYFGDYYEHYPKLQNVKSDFNGYYNLLNDIYDTDPEIEKQMFVIESLLRTYPGSIAEDYLQYEEIFFIDKDGCFREFRFDDKNIKGSVKLYDKDWYFKDPNEAEVFFTPEDLIERGFTLTDWGNLNKDNYIYNEDDKKWHPKSCLDCYTKVERNGVFAYCNFEYKGEYNGDSVFIMDEELPNYPGFYEELLKACNKDEFIIVYSYNGLSIIGEYVDGEIEWYVDDSIETIQ